MNTNTRVEKAIQELRESPVPEGAKQRLLARLSARPRRGHRLVWLGAAGAGLALVAGIAAWPRPSVAAEVRRAVQATMNATNRIERQWNVAPDGTKTLFMEMRSDGKAFRWHVRDAATQYYADGRLTNAFSAYATVETTRWTAAGPPKSLAELMSLDGVGPWNVERGEKLDRYRSSFTFQGRKLPVELVAEHAGGRLVEESGTGPNGQRWLYEWTYGIVTPADVAFNPAPGFRTYDIDADRSQFLEEVRSGRDLIGLWTDEQGFTMAFVRTSSSQAKGGQTGNLMANGAEGEPATLSWNGEGGKPAKVEGTMVLAYTARFERLPNVLSLLTLVDADGTLTNYENVKVHRTGSLATTFMPMNVPFTDERAKMP